MTSFMSPFMTRFTQLLSDSSYTLLGFCLEDAEFLAFVVVNVGIGYRYEMTQFAMKLEILQYMYGKKYFTTSDNVCKLINFEQTDRSFRFFTRTFSYFIIRFIILYTKLIEINNYVKEN